MTIGHGRSTSLLPSSIVKRTLRSSTLEGMVYGAFLALGDHFLIAFAVALQSNSLQIGLLASVPGFLGSVAQLFDAELVRLLKSRKAVILIFALAQGLMFVPIFALAFLPGNDRVLGLIVLTTCYSVFGSLVSPAWGSLMAEVVPDRLRGRYFALRGRLSTLSMMVVFLAAGGFLNLLASRALWGFGVLFLMAATTRVVSWLLLTRLYEVPQGPRHQPTPSHEAPAPASPPPLGRYFAFLITMAFVVNLASPFFAVYQLRDLKMSYLTFAALDTVLSLATLLAITHWGQAADRVGNRRVLVWTSAMIPLVPLLWLLSSNVYYLAAVQALSGVAWAGFSLCSLNYLFDATAPPHRTRLLSYLNAGTGLAAGLGALLGGVLLPHLPALLGHRVLSLFLISGLLRALVVVAFVPGIGEVRKVSSLPAAELFHLLLGGRPVNRRMSHRHHFQVHHHEPAAKGKGEASQEAGNSRT